MTTTKKAFKKPTVDHFQAVTDKLIAELEKGNLFWTKPWSASNTATDYGLPHNAATGHNYNGVNFIITAMTATEYGCNQFVTYKQAQALGGNIIKGEKACTYVSYFGKGVKETENAKGETRKEGFCFS